MKHLQSHQVWEYLDGELDLQDLALYDNHLSMCLDCRRRVDEFRKLSNTMRQVLKADIPDTSSEFHSELLTALRKSAGRPAVHAVRGKNRKHRLHRRLVVGIGSAAAVVVAAAVGWYSWQGGFAIQKTNPSSVAVTGVGTGSGSSPRSGIVSKTIGRSSTGTSIGTGAGDNTSPAGVSLATTVTKALTGEATLTVQSVSGVPVSNANVAFMAGGRILGTAVTDDSGAIKPMLLTVPTDPVLDPVFAQSGQSPEGDMTVVVWKQGYRPTVSYDVRVFQGGTSQFSQTLTLEPSTSSSDSNPKLAGYGFQNGTESYHLLSISAYVNWVESAVTAHGNNGITTPQPVLSTHSIPPQDAGALQFTVVDQNGHVVKGAHIAVVAGNKISGTSITGTSGQSPLIGTPGIADWRFIGPWNVGGLSPRSAAVVVWKQGYAPAVGMYVPLSTTSTTRVKVKLESLAWRKAAGWQNLDAPSAISPERMPTEANASMYVNWAAGQVN